MNVRKPKLYVHIGLPKTATTSLQSETFEKYHGKYWCYLGVMQPRGRVQGGAYDTMYQISRGHLPDNYVSVDVAENDLPYLLSEEMFLVDEPEISWQMKLKNLSILNQYYDTSIILTLRRSEKFIFSLYIQLYHSLSKNCATLDSFINQCNQSLIADYKVLLSEIEKYWSKENIHLLQFEGLKDHSTLRCLEKIFDVPDRLSPLPHLNVKHRTSDSVHTRPLTFGEWVSRKLSSSSKYSLKGALRFICRLTRITNIQREVKNTSVSIEYPDYEKLNYRWRESNLWLKKEYNIDYT